MWPFKSKEPREDMAWARPGWVAQPPESITREQRIKAFRGCFNNTNGHIVLSDLADRCNVFRTHGGDPFMEGQRSVVLYILQALAIEPSELQSLRGMRVDYNMDVEEVE